MLDVVVFLVSLGVRVIRAMCRRRADLVLENVALRQQVTALKKERPRPPLDDTERAFWVALRGSWTRRVLRHALREYVVYHHHERNHQGKENPLLFPSSDQLPRSERKVRSRERFGGLLRFYHRDAA